MRKHMDANVNFMLPSWAKEKFWRLCQERGLLPSQVLRETVMDLISLWEREREKADSNSNTEGGER